MVWRFHKPVMVAVCFCYICGFAVFYALDVWDGWPGLSQHWWGLLVLGLMTFIGGYAVWGLECLMGEPSKRTDEHHPADRDSDEP